MNSDMEKLVVLITTPNEEVAVKIANALVGENLAACANIVRGIRSICRWKGEVCDDTECLMVVKTTSDRFDALKYRVKVLHPYEVPEIIALPIAKGFEPYLKWVEENTRIG